LCGIVTPKPTTLSIRRIMSSISARSSGLIDNGDTATSSSSSTKARLSTSDPTMWSTASARMNMIRVLPVIFIGFVSARHGGRAIGSIAGMHIPELLLVEQHRLTDLAGKDVLPRQRFELHGQVERMLE